MISFTNALSLKELPNSLSETCIFLYLIFHFIWGNLYISSFAFVEFRVLFLLAVGIYLFAKGHRKDISIYFFGPSREIKKMVLGTIFFLVPIIFLRILSRSYFSGLVDVSVFNVVAQVIIPPLNEEIVFRSLFLSILLVRFEGKPLLPIVLTSLIFVIIHDFNSVIEVLNFGISGAVYAIAFLYLKNVFVPIFLHSLWNSFSFFPALFTIAN